MTDEHALGDVILEVPSVDGLANAYVVEAATLDPLLATYAGIAGFDDLMTDFSPDGYRAREELSVRTLAALARIDPTNDRERIAKAAMTERLQTEHDYGQTGLDRVVNVIAGPTQDVRAIFDLMPLDTEEERAAVASRLRAVGGALSGYRASLADELAADRRPARRQVEAASTMVRGWLRDDFFGDLVKRSGADGFLLADMTASAASATEAYSEYADYLETDLLPASRENDGVGAELYATASRMFLGAAIDPHEAYAWGWEELARIKADLASTANEITGSADVQAAKEALDADPARRITGAEAFRDWMQARSDEALRDLTGTHFEIPEQIQVLECRLAPTKDGGIYYTGPSADFTRPGRMWWSVPPGEDTFSTWKELTTVYHEGVPGHHLQVAQTVYRSELLNDYQRLMCWVSGHGEGWALYAERLMGELGYLEDPGNRLGMLDSQQFRAARVVIDIGCHLGLTIPDGSGFHDGETWNDELALEFLDLHSSMGPATRRFELNRYHGWPGQAPSYKLGERLWLQAREDVKTRKGGDFDLKAFHAAALNLGSMGLDPLRAELDRL